MLALAVEHVPPPDAKDHPPGRCDAQGGGRASSNRMNAIFHVEEQDRSILCSASIDSMKRVPRPVTCFFRRKKNVYRLYDARRTSGRRCSSTWRKCIGPASASRLPMGCTTSDDRSSRSPEWEKSRPRRRTLFGPTYKSLPATGCTTPDDGSFTSSEWEKMFFQLGEAHRTRLRIMAHDGVHHVGGPTVVVFRCKSRFFRAHAVRCTTGRSNAPEPSRRHADPRASAVEPRPRVPPTRAASLPKGGASSGFTR
jgi:hypothetical protein